MVAGLVTAVVIILLSPTFRQGGAILPISSPGLISIPVGFLVMYVISLLTQPKGEALSVANKLFDRIRIQAVTGMDPGDPDFVPPSQRISAH